MASRAKEMLMRVEVLPLPWLAFAGWLALAPSAHADPRRLGVPQGAMLPGPSEREIVVVNRSPLGVNELYVSPANSDQWGTDRLGDETLAPGQSFRVRLGRTRDCLFDLQMVYEDATHEDRHNVDACRARQVVFDASGAVPIARAKHEVTLINGEIRPIQQVFLSPPNSSQWGDDLLGNTSLSVHADATVTYQGPCQADLRVVYDNRSAEERRDIDVCADPRLVIAPGWTTADRPPAAPHAPAGEVVVAMLNRTGHDITELYVYPDGSADHGPDRLGSDVLKDGVSLPLNIERSAGCKFTVRVVFSGHVPDLELGARNLCAGPELILSP